MKRNIIVLGIFLLYSSLAISQSGGSGTSSDPYYGTISINTNWFPDTYPNSTIYCQNIEIAPGVTLTINPGIYYGGKVQFTPTRTLTINSGGVVIIFPGTAVTVYRINNNGTLRLESDPNEAGVASLIHDIATGTGINEVKVYLSGGKTLGGLFKWHYISVPVNNVSVSTFATLNLAQYVESLVTGPDNYPGWIAYDGYQYSSGNTLGYLFNTLSLYKGYNYYSESGNTFTLTGPIYIDEYSQEIDLTCGTGYSDYQGYNLLGNPFASCLDWDYMVNNYFVPGTVNNAIYFTLNGSIASYVSGVGDNGGTGTIPPMQGFFVKANSPSSIIIPRSARTHNLDQLRYKKGEVENYKSSDSISFVRLKLESLGDSTDLVVRFNKKATAAVDRIFDAYEFSKTSGDINIWTTTGDVDYSINGLPFPETTTEIPVGINVQTAGSFKLSSSEINNLSYYSVTLIDLLTNATIDLNKEEFFEFYAAAGIMENRFILAITKSTTDIYDQLYGDKRFRVYSSSGDIIISYISNEYTKIHGSVVVYDISGRKVYSENNMEWNGNGEIKRIKLNPDSKGIFIIEIKSGKTKFVEKVSLL